MESTKGGRTKPDLKGKPSGRLKNELDPRSPGGRLEALAVASGNKSAFAKKLGINYALLQRWVNGRGFNAKNQRTVIETLNLPSNYFADPDSADARRAAQQRVWEEFCKSHLAIGMTARQRSTLGIWSANLAEDAQVDLLFYSALLNALQRVMPEELQKSLQHTQRLIESGTKKGRKVIKP